MVYSQMAACGMYHQQGNHQMKILDLLLQLEAAAPPIVPHTHHCLMVTKYGSDEIGWTNKLTLQMNVNGNFQSFFIDDKDLEKPVEDVVAEVIALLKAPTPYTQTSSQAGLALETGTCSTPGHSGDNHIHEYSCSDFIPVTQ